MNEQSQELAPRLLPSRLPIAPAIAKEFEVKPAEWRVLVEQIFPNAKTVEAVTMALSYCRARNLDIFKKPVHIVPMWSSAAGRMVETVWPGISEIRTTAARTGEYGGIDAVVFGPKIERDFTGKVKNGAKWDEVTKTVTFPETAAVTVYRIVKGIRCPFSTEIDWLETYASIGVGGVPNEMWAHRPKGQLGKCIEAAALRMAFPEEVGSMYAAEEMEGKAIDFIEAEKPERAKATIVTPVKPGETRPLPPVAGEQVDESQTEPDKIEAFLAVIETALAPEETEDAVIGAWDALDVEATLTGNEDDLARAFAIRKAKIDALAAQHVAAG